MDDRALTMRARGGDPIAFEALVRRHTATVWRFARTIVADDQLAEEIVQDTFLKAHQGLSSFRGDSAVTTWLYTICRRTALDRTRRRPRAAAPLDLAETLPGAEVSTDDRLALHAAIESLPVDEREAFVLTAVLGYSREDASELVGIPASTMRSRVARARTRLIAALTLDEEDL